MKYGIISKIYVNFSLINVQIIKNKGLYRHSSLLYIKKII